MHKRAGFRMYKSQCFSMQGLALHDAEAVLDKGIVFWEFAVCQCLHATICFVGKKGMTDVLHVCPDLMRSAGFQFAFYQGAESKSLQYLVMGYGMFAVFTIGKNS